MGRVRQAGYLYKKENDTLMKHWCVVRDRSFIVYPFQPKIKNIRADTDGSPIHTLPMEQLSVNHFVQPAGPKDTEVDYSIELFCAKSGVKLVFYTNHEASLERWVNAIKAESSLDDLTPQNSPHGALLPPEINSEPIPLSPDSESLTSFCSSIDKEAFPAKESKLNRDIGDFQAEVRRSNRKLSKTKKVSSMSNNLSQSFENLSNLHQPNVEPAEHPTSLSSPIRSSTTVTLSSQPLLKPALTSQTKTSFSRHPVISPLHKRYKGGSELKRSPLALNHHDGILDLNPDEANSRGASSKRHTICDMPDVDFLKQDLPRKEERKPKPFYSNTLALTKPFRHSIAPLASLDLRLKQKKRKTILPFERYATKSDDLTCTDNSDSSEDEASRESSQLSLKNSKLTVQVDRGNELNDAFRSRDLNANVLRHQQLKSGGLNMSMPNLDEVQEKSLMKVPSFEEPRKTSGSFGSRVLKRVSSAVGKRGKSEDETTKSTSSLNLDTSTSYDFPDDKNFVFKASESPTSTETSTLPNESNRFVVMEGWLYRRKMMSWNKNWAILSSNRMLEFYKSSSTSSSSDVMFSMNLSHGCNVEDIAQNKNLNTFWLRPRTPNSSESDVESSLKEDSLSKSIGKPIQLMCKSTQEFMHWMKEFLLLNSALFGGRNAVLPTPKHKLKSEVRSNVDTKKQNGVSRQNSNELNNNWKYHFQDRPLDVSISSSVFSNDNGSYRNKSYEGKKKSQSSLNTLDTNSSDELDSFDDGKVSELASPAIKVTFCDGSSIDNEQSTSLQDISAKSHDTNDIRSEGDALMDRNNKNKQHYKNENKSRHFVGNSLPAENANTQPINREFFAVQKYSYRSIIESDIKIPASDSYSNKTGAKNNAPFNNKLGNEVELNKSCTELLETETKEEQTTNKETSISASFSGEQFLSNVEPQTNERSNLMKNFQSRGLYGASGTTWLENESTKEKKLSLKPANERTFTNFPFFSQSNLSHSHHSQAISVGVTAPGVQSAALTESKADEAELPAVIERIKLFESFVSEPKKVGSFEEPANADALGKKETERTVKDKNIGNKTNLHLSPSLEKDLNISSNTPKPSLLKFNSCSVENLRDFSSTKQKSLPVPIDQLRRATSDSNLLESSGGETYRMKGMRKPVPELSRIDFIEIYGMPKSLNVSQVTEQFLGLNDIPHAKRRNSVESDENSLPTKDASEENSVASLLSESKQTASTNEEIASPRLDSESEASEGSNKNEERANWRFSMIPKLRKSVHRSSDRRASKEQVLQLPASQLKTASHRGYLNKRSKRKLWEKFWCVYQDACLYFYNSPHSDKTRDVIVLRGYEVIADVTKINRETFEFRLQQEGSRTLYFSTDNFEEFLLWVGTLEKETRSIKAQERKSCYFFESVDGTAPESNSFQQSSEDSSAAPSPMLPRSLSHDRLESEIVEMQKHKLLKELASQQEKLLEEQRVWDRFYGNESPVQTPDQEKANAIKRQDVISKFDRAREQEEAIATKTMAFLNRRRNSAQLKLDQMVKELAPKSGKKRRDDHKHFAALEAKQAEMKKKLSNIDKEIFELQANKQNALEKIQHRQDLALVVAEQQENLDIIVRNCVSTSDAPRVRKRHQSNPIRKGLSSIDEVYRASDSASTDSGSGENKLHRSKLTPYDETQSAAPPVFDDPSKDIHPQTILRTLSSDVTLKDYYFQRSYSSEDSLSRNPTSLSSSLHSLGSSTELLHQSASSSINKRNKDEINPSVIAGIEDFEKFSAKKLEKLKRNSLNSNC